MFDAQYVQHRSKTGPVFKVEETTEHFFYVHDARLPSYCSYIGLIREDYVFVDPPVRDEIVSLHCRVGNMIPPSENRNSIIFKDPDTGVDFDIFHPTQAPCFPFTVSYQNTMLCLRIARRVPR